MRKLLLLVCVVLLSTISWGQSGTTVVTAQVKDTNGSLYTNCQWSVVFVGENTTPGQGPYQPAPLLVGQQGTCDSFGKFTVNLADNINTVTPTPSQWSFSICSAAGYLGGPFCKTNILITITGPQQDLTSTLTPIMPLLPTSGGTGGTIVFNGVPTGPCLPPQTAVNSLTGDFYSCVGGVWIKIGPGGGAGGNPGGSAFNLQTNVAGVSFGGISNAGPGSVLASNGTSAFPVFQLKSVNDVRDFAVAGGITSVQVGDGQAATDCWMTSGSPTLTCTSSHFAAGDVGKQIAVYGAGAKTSGFIQPLATTISGFTSATQITLTANASNSTTQGICAISSAPTGASMSTTGVITITCNASHNFSVGQDVIISGISDYRMNSPRNPDGTYGTVRVVSTPTGTSFTFQSPWRLFTGTATSGGGTANGNSERVVWGTDNTAAIQAAVDACATTTNQNLGGCQVFFPAAGTFQTIYLTNAIKFPCAAVGTFSLGTCTKSYNNITLAGPGRDLVGIESWNPDAVCLGAPGNACSTVLMGQFTNLPQNEGGPDANTRLKNLTIHDLTIRLVKYATSAAAKAIFDMGFSDGVNIYNNAIVGYSYECVIQHGGFASRNWHFHDNNLGPCGRGGPGTGSTDSAINMNGSWSEAYNNYVSDSGQAVESAGHHMVFKNNWFYGTNVAETPGDCINLGSSGAGLWDITISGNVCQDWPSGLVSGNGSGTLDRIYVNGNVFRDAPVQLAGGGESNTVTYPLIELDTVIHGSSTFSNNTVISNYYITSSDFGVVVGSTNQPQLSQEHWTLSKNTFTSNVLTANTNVNYIALEYNSPKGWTPSASCTSTGQIPTIMMPTVPNGFYYRCTTGGTSGTTEPAWCTTSNCTVTDNTAVWTFAGQMPITTISDTRFDIYPGGATSGLDIVWDNTNMESAVFTNITANYAWTNSFRTVWNGGCAISLGSPGGCTLDATVPVNTLWGTKNHYNTAVPASGKWSLGDVVWQKSPAAAGFAGWIVTTAGYATDTWGIAQPYNFNYYIQPSPQNGHFYREITAGTCTSGGSQPSFPTGAGATVADNTCTWKESGASAVFSAVSLIGSDATGSGWTIPSLSSTTIGTTGSNGGISATEGTGAGVPAGAGIDVFWADSTAHRFKMNNNNGGAQNVLGSSDFILQDCGTTTTCANTVKDPALIVRGSVAFATATTVTVTTLPFTSSTSYSCTAGDVTTAAGVINATTYTSGASVTFTETNGVNTDTIRYVCVGF